MDVRHSVLKPLALGVVEHLPQEGRPAHHASDEGDRRRQQEEDERAFLPGPAVRRMARYFPTIFMTTKMTTAPKKPPPASSQASEYPAAASGKTVCVRSSICIPYEIVALVGDSALVLRIAKAIKLQVVRCAIKTINRASPCLSEYRNSIYRQVGRAFAFRTTVSQWD